jgi:hypothetical protein
MTMKRRLIAGDTREYPFNTPFTNQEHHVLRMIDNLRARVKGLKAAMGKLPQHACKPPENYKPDRMEEFPSIEEAIASLEEQLRWIPGGAYRFATDEHQTQAIGSPGSTVPIPRRGERS